jgi:hypothetical protein
VNRCTAYGGFVGSRSKKFIQNNQFNTSENRFDPTKGTPLSKPGSVGNVNDLAISIPPKYAEPVNGELNAILSILNGKPVIAEHAGKLSAKQVESLGRKSKKLTRFPDGAVQTVNDFTNTQNAMKRETMIRKAVSQGFSVEEAKAAYAKIRVKEAEVALVKDEDPSVRLYDLIDSKISGTQNGSVRGNDETGLFLAKGGNAVMVRKAEARNDAMDAVINRARGRPSDKALAEMSGQTIEEIKESRRLAKGPSKDKLLAMGLL